MAKAFSPKVMGFASLNPSYALWFGVGGDACRRRNWLAVFLQAVEMKFDRLAYFVLHGLDGRRRGNAAGQVRHIGRVVALRVFDHDGVPHQHSAVPTA